MDFETLVKERRSIRGYKPDPVPKEVIEEIVEIAKGAPSSMNTQPWFLHVITGEPLDRIREGNTERMLAGAEVHREIPVHDAYKGYPSPASDRNRRPVVRSYGHRAGR